MAFYPAQSISFQYDMFNLNQRKALMKYKHMSQLFSVIFNCVILCSDIGFFACVVFIGYIVACACAVTLASVVCVCVCLQCIELCMCVL